MSTTEGCSFTIWDYIGKLLAKLNISKPRGMLMTIILIMGKYATVFEHMQDIKNGVGLVQEA